MKHATNCLGYLCTCGAAYRAASFQEIEAEPDCAPDCACEACALEREAALDREFDEKVALAYI